MKNYILDFMIRVANNDPLLQPDMIAKIAIVRAHSVMAARAYVHTFYTEQGHTVIWNSKIEKVVSSNYPYDFTY